MKKINMEYGSDEGDELLILFSDILKETFRETDVIARIGGDEFVVLMNDSDYCISDHATFTRLTHNVDKFNNDQSKPYHLVIDTGLVEYNKDKHVDLTSILNEGERLVYERHLKRSSN